MNKSHSPLNFGSLLQDFFCQYLMNQRNLSPRTVASYRDAFRLLLNFVKERKRKSPAKIQMADLDPGNSRLRGRSSRTLVGCV